MNVITKAMLDQLRAERMRKNAQLDYTIGGPIQASVVSTIETEREKKIKQGEHILQNALHDMEREQALSSHKGLAKVHFNHSKQEIEP